MKRWQLFLWLFAAPTIIYVALNLQGLLILLVYGSGLLLALRLMWMARQVNSKARVVMLTILALALLGLQGGCWYIGAHFGSAFDSSSTGPDTAWIGWIIGPVAAIVVGWFVMLLLQGASEPDDASPPSSDKSDGGIANKQDADDSLASVPATLGACRAETERRLRNPDFDYFEERFGMKVPSHLRELYDGLAEDKLAADRVIIQHFVPLHKDSIDLVDKYGKDRLLFAGDVDGYSLFVTTASEGEVVVYADRPHGNQDTEMQKMKVNFHELAKTPNE